MWKPHEVRKLIAQLSGVALGIASLLLILEELQATGLIKLSSSLSSGDLSKGSIGLFLLCLSLLLIALPALWGAQPIDGLRDPAGRFKIIATQASIRRFALVTVAGVILSLTLLFGGEFLTVTYDSKIGALLQLAGTVAGVLSGAMLVFLGFAWVDAASRSASVGREEEPDR
jgi:hypothetical protein